MKLVNKIKELKYKIKLRTFTFNHNYDKKLDIIVQLLTNDDFKITSTYGGLKFENHNYEIEIWDNNKYYAWLSRGKFKNLNTKDEWEWEDVRSSVRSMYDLKQKLSNDKLRKGKLKEVLKRYSKVSEDYLDSKLDDKFYGKLI